MRNASPDTAQVLVLPPLVYGAACVMGLLLHLVFPLHVLPSTLARGIGVVCVLVSLPLALGALPNFRSTCDKRGESELKAKQS